MTKKHPNPSSAALREAADAAVDTWRELETVAQAKRAAHDNFGAALPPDRRSNGHFDRSTPTKLRMAELYREAVEAEDAADRARHAAVVALDAAELAEGDELALARDPKRLYDELAVLDAEESALQTQLADVDRRRAERRMRAFAGDGQNAARRVAASLPPSTPLPRPTFDRPYLTALAERVEKGVPMPSRAAQIIACRADERRMAADLEEERIKKEEQEKEEAARKANAERQEAEANKRMATQTRERREANEAEARKREQLAANYQARRASGGAA
jgi:hypothetical protein